MPGRRRPRLRRSASRCSTRRHGSGLPVSTRPWLKALAERSGDGGGRGVALTDTFEDSFALLDIPRAALAPGEADHFDTLAIEIVDDAGIDDEHPEPSMAAAPLFIEFDEPARLDPD